MSAKTADRIGAAALWALAALQLIWHAGVRPHLWVAVATLLPLLPALGMWLRERRRGLLLGAFLGLIYFCHGVMEAWSDPSTRGLGLLEAGLELLLVLALGMATREEKRIAREKL